MSKPGQRGYPNSITLTRRWGPKNGGVPRYMIVLCHGVASDGGQLAGVARAWADTVPEAIFIAPDAPFPSEKMRDRCLRRFAGVDRRQWYPLKCLTPQAAETGVRTAAELLDRFIDIELLNLGLSPNALVLMGFSQGAMVSLYAGLRRAVAPKAIISFSGTLIGADNLQSEIRNKAPVVLIHGERDRVVPISGSQNAREVLRRLNVPVEIARLPNVGHRIERTGLSAGALLLRRALC